MYIYHWGQVTIDSQLHQPLRRLHSLSISILRIPRGCHSCSRWQIAVERLQTINLSSLLICADKQGNLRISLGPSRQNCYASDSVIRGIKVMIAKLTEEATYILVHHPLF